MKIERGEEVRHELFRRLGLKAEETTGAKVLSRTEPGVIRGSKETNVTREKAASSQRHGV